MARKTNKTSHVLNLLTSDSVEEEVPASSQEEKKSAPASEVSQGQTQVKPIPEQKVIVVNETSENEKISNEIKNRLAEELKAAEEALAKEPGGPESYGPGAQENGGLGSEELEAQETSGLESEALETQEMKDMEDEEPEAQGMNGPGSWAPEAQETEEPAPQKEENVIPMAPEERYPGPVEEASADEAIKGKKQYHIVNVMEQILEFQNLEKQMEQYGVCGCSRCQADVRALILTQMPAKYVVVDQTSIAPIIGYYEGKYRSRVFTEIMKACVKVKDNPRH